MMPTNENLYGQWPKCGEIDIMEVMGQQTNKLYGTIHMESHMRKARVQRFSSMAILQREYHTFVL